MRGLPHRGSAHSWGHDLNIARFKETHVMSPLQSCNNLLHRVGVVLGEGSPGCM
jgi:hypothetical protein